MYNCTVRHNIAERSVHNIGRCTIFNTISYEYNYNYLGLAGADSEITAVNSCGVMLDNYGNISAYPGTGNITNNPLLKANYKLNYSSPCRDTGTNQAWMTGAKDLQNKSRIFNSIVDMGAYEWYIPPDIYVATNGNDSAAGTNWATAKRTIQAGITAAEDYGTVWVSNGVYAGCITNGSDVVLRSANNDPTNTIIIGTGGSRSITSTDNGWVIGFTIMNGNEGYGGGIQYGYVSNCIITSNAASLGGGASDCTMYNCIVTNNWAPIGGGVYNSTLYNCSLADNLANYGGAAARGSLYNCVISNNWAVYGGGTYEANLYNCLIHDNYSSSMGGGSYAGVLYNCTVVSNAADYGGGICESTVYNCISWDNSVPDIFLSDELNYYSCGLGYAGIGSITNNPLLLATYELDTNSPCIGAGTNQVWMAELSDLAENKRIWPWDGLADMGAYEYGSTNIYPPHGPLKAIYPLPLNGADAQATNIVILSWLVDDSTIASDVYFGETNNMIYQGSTAYSYYIISNLLKNTPYQWRIDTTNSVDKATGDTWNFITVGDSVLMIAGGEMSGVGGNGVSNIIGGWVGADINDICRAIVVSNPQSVFLNLGDTVSLNVEAIGTPPLAYQWQKNYADILGAISTNYTIAVAASNDIAGYRCVVTNIYGAATSTIALLAFNVPVSIVSNPVSAVKNPGIDVGFKIVVAGTPPITYQWQKNNTDIPGADSALYLMESVVSTNEGAYRCIASNILNAVTSAVATLTVNGPTYVITQPQSITNDWGTLASFTVTAGGTVPHYYQWQTNGVNIAFANTDTYFIPEAIGKDATSYRCIISNVVNCVTSDVATLTLNDPVTILINPQNTTNNVDTPAIFSVTATGSPSLTYAWQHNESNITGATASVYSTYVGNNSSGDYRCVVSSPYGAATSTAARLTLGKWLHIAGMPAADLMWGASGAWSNYIFHTGGLGYSAGHWTAVTNVYRYDILNNSWTQTVGLTHPVYNHGLVTVDSDMYIFGGRDYDYHVYSNTYLYANSNWITPAMGYPLRVFQPLVAAKLDGNNKIFGGYTNYWTAVTNVYRWYYSGIGATNLAYAAQPGIPGITDYDTCGAGFVNFTGYVVNGKKVWEEAHPWRALPDLPVSTVCPIVAGLGYDLYIIDIQEANMYRYYGQYHGAVPLTNVQTIARPNRVSFDYKHGVVSGTNLYIFGGETTNAYKYIGE